jgi:hypothetical protein
VKFYGDCVKMCEDFAENFGDKRTSSCIATTHRLTLPFSSGNFDQKQHEYRPLPTLLFSDSPIEDKTGDLHFDTIEVIVAESQAVLNTLTEHDRTWQKRWERCIHSESDCLESGSGLWA